MTTATTEPCLECGYVRYRPDREYHAFDCSRRETTRTADEPRGLARLDSTGLAELAEILADAIDDGKPCHAEGASPNAALPWCFYPSDQFWRNETARTNTDRLDFIAAVRAAIIAKTKPAAGKGAK